MIRAIARLFTMAMALVGGLFFSQAPEFTQQYRQRIGGALDELNVMISRFDVQARRHGLDRERALDTYTNSPQIFLREQGKVMRRTFSRHEALQQQQRQLAETPPLVQPLVLIRNPDSMTLTNAWEDFSPAVPVDPAGLIWTAAGLVTGWILAVISGLFGRGVARVWRRPGSAQAVTMRRQ